MAKQIIEKKGAKKTFFEVSAPITATKISLYSHNIEELDNRIVKLDLTKSLKGKSLELKLRIKKENESLIAEPETIELSGSYIRRAMRRSTDYAEDSFETECRDSLLRIKPFMIARKRVSRVILKALRNAAKKEIESYVKTRTAKELFSEIITNKLQKHLAIKMKKIYPLAFCEIRFFEIVKKKDSE